ncbi:MAG: hypothetical protein KIPDCIKN_03044 [Haliscomenobacter sp.]|nr:hypothetical protein [Haliscomenobacter sp.]
MRIALPIWLILLSLAACKERTSYQQTSYETLKVVKAVGREVPSDSLAQPRVVDVDETKLQIVQAKTPQAVQTNRNIMRAGNPKIIPVDTGSLIRHTPGKNGLKEPVRSAARGLQVKAGSPEVVVAKDRVSKDLNPQNFSSFGKLQGLKYNVIQCLLKDHNGNLWMGTVGGGITKYDGKFFTHYSEAEGLLNNSVLSILEDRNGNLWFGTEIGLSRFDGTTFTQYMAAEGFVDGEVLAMLEDPSGRLWLGTSSGLIAFDGKAFVRYTTEQGLPHDEVRCIAQDQSGALWIGTHGGGLARFDGAAFTHFTENEGLSNNHVSSILEDQSGRLWIGTNSGGLLRFDGKTFALFTEEEGLSNNAVYRLMEDRAGNLWIGTLGGGASKLSRQKGSETFWFTHYTENEGLNHISVIAMLEDDNGALWMGTDGGGLNLFQGNTFTHYTESEGISNRSVFSIISDRNKHLWFATFGGGVNRYDGRSFSPYTQAEGLLDNSVYDLLEDRKGNIWLANSSSGVTKFDGQRLVHYSESNGLSNNEVLSILEDKNGALWFSTRGGGVSRFEPNPVGDGGRFTHFGANEGLGGDIVFSMLEDRKGNLWFCTMGAGVTKYDGRQFTQFTETEGMSHNSVLSVCEDRSGNLWFGTMGGGVTWYDGRRFVHLTEEEGLSHNVVLSLLEDRNGNMWFGTRFGLSKLARPYAAKLKKTQTLTRGGLRFKNYSYEDGFLGIGCWRNSLFEAEDGTIYIGANDRLTAYRPEKTTGQAPPAPVIQLTNVALFNEPIPWALLENNQDTSFALGNGVRVGDFKFAGLSSWYALPRQLSLKHNNNYLSFSFIGITLTQPEKIKYQYQLVGLDEHWSGLTSKNEAHYGNIPYGQYTFRVKAQNAAGNWSKAYAYAFTIRPPWWRTPWAYAGYVLFTLLLIWGIVLVNTWRLRRDKERLERMVKARTAEIEQQKEVIDQEREKAESLLLNILPAETAAELKEKGYTTARRIEQATVLFSDIRGFTQVAETMQAEELVQEINIYFSAFDEIMGQYGLEKIKTVGDAYIAAGGVPNHNQAGPLQVVEAALAMQAAVARLKAGRQQQNKSFFELRIGIHTGPLVAGVVGIKKFQYDIWGDTVNIAARLEETSEPGRVNISQSTYLLVRDQFHCIPRGMIEAKNKGEVEMYFVEGVTRLGV